jgi:ABC-type transporter Mla MlaB component
VYPLSLCVMTEKSSPVTIFIDGTSGISVTGTLDATTLPELNRSVIEFFELGGASEIDVLTLDLSTVSACDQAASAAVRHAQSVCAERSVALRVVPSEAVRQVMAPRR